MVIYTKEKGFGENIKLNKTDKSVDYVNGEYVINCSILTYTEEDKKNLERKYEDYKTIFKNRKIDDMYKENYKIAIDYFIKYFINERNFVFTINSKPYLLARILYDTLMGDRVFNARPGYSIGLVSDIARMKDEIVYPLLFTCKNLTYNNFRTIVKLVLNCPCYYFSDFHNILKDEVKKLYWSTIYDKQMAQLEAYGFNDDDYVEQYLTVSSLKPIVERFVVKGGSQAGEVKIVHDKKYEYDKKMMYDLSINHIDLEYQSERKEPLLELADELASFFHSLFMDCLNLYRSNALYTDCHFTYLSNFLTLLTQGNVEFQMPVNEWAFLMGVMDLCNDQISDFYKDNKIVDNIILCHYTRLSEYLKNHSNDKKVFTVFKTRVLR